MAAKKGALADSAPRRRGLEEQELRKELRGENIPGSYHATRWIGSRPGTGLLYPEDYKEYANYIDRIIEPLEASQLQLRRVNKRLEGRALLHSALEVFFDRLKEYVTGCEERQFSKANLKRARSIEAQLPGECENLLQQALAEGTIALQEMHGIWFGFSLMRTWRSATVPQECLLAMIRGLLSGLTDDEVEAWSNEALTEELTDPKVHKSLHVSAWPALCELLGRLPDFVTPDELREVLWKQSFLENPTHAPDHRNYKRFAMLATQMVTIGVELESDKVQHLVEQVLYLERPWRERRDMLCGILSAASVRDRQMLVNDLDRRFEEHAELDDFEILCGISEHLGVEVPRGGAVRRTALRRWALDPKRGGALPVSRLIDFVDGDALIGEDVSAELRKKGRIADAAVLLSRLPKPEFEKSAGDDCGILDYHNGEAELTRLQHLLSMDLDDLEGEGAFGPVAEGALKLPFGLEDGFQLSEDSDQALEAVERLQGAPVLAIACWKEEAPFWHAPVICLAICSDGCVEIFDLVKLRTCSLQGWAEASNQIRAILSDPEVLKIGYGIDIMSTFVYALGLGVAATLKRNENRALGPLLDMQGVMAGVLGIPVDPPDPAWHPGAIAARFLGFKVCNEEDCSNWARRPVRASQLHHMALEAWSQIPIVRALFSYDIVPKVLLQRHLKVRDSIGRGAFARIRALKNHVPGQLAPAGRLLNPGDTGVGEARAETPTPVVSTVSAPARKDDADGPRLLSIAEEPVLRRIAVMRSAVVPEWRELGTRSRETPPELPAVAPRAPPAELLAGAPVKVFAERLGGSAFVVPIGESHSDEEQIVPTKLLGAVNSWDDPTWLAHLPRPSAATLEEAREEVVAMAAELAPKERQSTLAAAALVIRQQRDKQAQALVESLCSLPRARELLQTLCDAQNL